MPTDELLKTQRLIVCVGPGGVGKTTAAAALGARAAELGRKAVVMTIDPARRLADVLGLDGIDDAFQRVSLPDAPGELYAAMLDTKRSFDSLMARVCEDEAELEAIMENRIYVAFSRTTERAHAYIAMERLYDALQDPRFDLVILDTPPAENALEILDSAGRLVRFLNSRTLRWLLRWGPKGGGRFGGISSLFGKALGAGLLTEIVTFLRLFAAMTPGFERRARTSESALLASDTSFVVVTRPRPMTLHASDRMWNQLVERGIRPRLTIFNRAGLAPSRTTDAERSRVASSEFSQLSSMISEHYERALQRDVAARASADASQRARGDSSQAIFLASVEPETLSIRNLSALLSPLG